MVESNMNRRTFLAASGAQALTLLTGCSSGSLDFNLQQRLVVKCGNRKFIGTQNAKVRVHVNSSYNLDYPSHIVPHVYGSCVHVDLPNGDKIYALLTSRNGNWLLPWVTTRREYNDQRISPLDMLKISIRDRQSVDITRAPGEWPHPESYPFGQYPQFVYSTKPNSVMSLTRMDPADLPVYDGQKLTLDSYVISLTDQDPQYDRSHLPPDLNSVPPLGWPINTVLPRIIPEDFFIV